MRLYDAHNHLQDDRFGGRQEALIAAAARAGVVRMVVNGSCESDWPQVRELAGRFPMVQASFGYHPWYVHERTVHWREALGRLLDQTPDAAVGEIGLDRWKPGLAYDGQEETFVEQLRVAAERDRPVSVHCLQAWGRLEELLRAGPRPGRGFLLHSYGGPAEMVKPLARLGAYFSFPGYFLHERKARQRETFRHVPPDRLLIETDAPDQLLPEPPPAPSCEPETPRFVIDPATGRRWNHPASLGAVCQGLATFLGQPVETLAARIEENFLRLFGAGGRNP